MFKIDNLIKFNLSQMDSATYKCWLDKNRLVINYLTGTLNNETQILVQNKGKPYYYYEGSLIECICAKSNTLRFVPHGYGTLYSIYNMQVILSGTFDVGQINGFANVLIPSKNIDMTCTYQNEVPNKKLPFLFFKDNNIELNI